MASKTFYLKYRPQRISELDSVDIRQSLQKVLRSGKVPHALLFVGPRGTGKTSAARIFAKAINCERHEKPATRRAGAKKDIPNKGSSYMESVGSKKEKRRLCRPQNDYEPCNQCTICKEITVGNALDLLEIDAASNRGIDDIRNLREKIKLAPARAKYKVYIVDEVHMLTTEAFNALLKTLEEPPAHAVFILCTTAPEKLPETIISRCLRFNFPKAKLQEIIDGPLKRAVKGEKLKVEKGVLEEIARSVDGSFRDAHKILEQLSFSGQKITLKETKELLGKIEALAPEKLLSLLFSRDVKTGLLEIDRIVKAGGSLTVYVQEILNRLRLALLVKVGLDDEALMADNQRMDFSLGELKVLIGLFSRAANEMRTNPIPQLPLELVVVEWGESGARTPLSSETRAEVNENKKTGSHSLSDSPIRSVVDKSNRSLTADQYSSERMPTPLTGSNGNGLEEIRKRWDELLAGVKPLNHSVEALLRAARPAQMDGEFLTLEVFYKFHKERLETEKCRMVVEEVAGQILGAPIKLRCVLGSKRSTDNTDFKRDYTDKSVKSSFQSVSPVDDDIMRTAEEIFGV